jgi:hypothetical protein
VPNVESKSLPVENSTIVPTPVRAPERERVELREVRMQRGTSSCRVDDESWFQVWIAALLFFYHLKMCLRSELL